MVLFFVFLAHLLISVVNCIEYLLLGYIILGWIVFFGVIKNSDSIFLRVYVFLMSKIEPILAPIRRLLPTVAGLDFSPIVVFFGLHLAKILIQQIFMLLIRAFNA